MSYNRNFRNMTTQSGRYNKPGQFVPASEPQGTPGRTTRASAAACNADFSSMASYDTTMAPPVPEPVQQSMQHSMQNENEQYNTNELMEPKTEEMDVSAGESMLNPDGTKKKPFWMKSGVKKISNKERRRRQNEHLRKLLSPKNALMVLNEMIGNKPEQTPLSSNVVIQHNESTFFGGKTPTFCAEITVEGETFKGFGETKAAARNSAAEQAIRSLAIRRMQGKVSSEGDMDFSNGDGQAANSDQTVPMIQLASYALHKLFTEWQCEGLPSNFNPAQVMAAKRVLEPKTPAAPKDPAVPKPPKAPKPPKTLPENAASMHPCMLLCQMRSGLVYHELGVEGDKPQNVMYTMGVTVDGTTYIGKASSKKEARKQAARSACQEVFKLQYAD